MVDSIHSSSSSSSMVGDLSPTTSLADSLVSMGTEEHNELYDHRQHPDFVNMNNDDEAVIDTVHEKNNDLDVHHTPGKQKESDQSYNSPKYDSNITRERRTSHNSHRSHHSNQSHPPHVQTPISQRRMTAESTDPVIQAAELAANKLKPVAHSNTRQGRVSHPVAYQDTTHVTQNPIQHYNTTGTPTAKTRRLSNTHSFSDMMHPKPRKTRARGNSSTSSLGSHGIKLAKSISVKSSENGDAQGKRKPRSSSFDSDNSQHSRESQETEEDVCFPMPPQLHTRVNGIDFDELEEFSQQSRQSRAEYLSSIKQLNNSEGTSASTATSSNSSAALKYIPRASAQQPQTDSQNTIPEEYGIVHEKDELKEKDKTMSPTPIPAGVSFGNNIIEGDNFTTAPSQYTTYFDNAGTNFHVPDRFSFFCSDSDETVHATDIPSLVEENQSFYELFRGGEPTWWLDCSCPTDDEMRCITKAFGIHPLTAEDIRMQEPREKVELFKSYYFVCFHTFENDKESEDFLEPINVYIVVFRSGVLTFHFNQVSHPASVRRRVRQLRDYVNVNSDWLCYALIDDITDSFAPVIQSIEYEADTIEDSVFMVRDIDFSVMLQRIGESRRKTMTLMRLLSGKADVIKMFAKRCQDEANGIGPALTSQINIANLQSQTDNIKHINPNNCYMPLTTQPRGDIAMYLGDIQDHLLTMFQNLSAYEKIFSRSHANYLAQLQVESFNSNNKVTEMLGKVTMIGTMLVPLNVITGLFGMNVKVPGGGVQNLAWWFGILGVLLFLAICSWFIANWWVRRMDTPSTLNEASESGARSVISSFFPRGMRNNRKNQRIAPTNRSIASLPSKYSRYD